jgi:integrase
MFKRGKIWWFSIDGVKESSGTTDRGRAIALERQRRQEAWDRAKGFHVRTWDEACLEWLREHQHLVSYEQNKQMAKWWLKHLTGLKLTAIDKDLVHRVIASNRTIDQTRGTKQNATANQYVAFVEKIIRAGKVLPDLKYYPKPDEAKRWLKPEEWTALEAKMDDDLRHICTFALGTGLREMNNVLFSWSWVHGAAAHIPRQLTKTRDDYGIPLSSVVHQVIEERRRATVRHPEFVFLNRGVPWEASTLLRRTKQAATAAGIDPMTFHTFRHTFASWLAQRGVSDAVRRRLGCWSAGQSASEGYVHFDVESLRPFSEMVFQRPVEQKREVGNG